MKSTIPTLAGLAALAFANIALSSQTRAAAFAMEVVDYTSGNVTHAALADPSETNR